MKTWILVAASTSAAVFLFDSVTQSLYLSRNIKGRRFGRLNRFAKYLCEEVEIACGAGTDASLILCGEAQILDQIQFGLSESIRSVVLRRLFFTHLKDPARLSDFLRKELGHLKQSSDGLMVG